MWGPSLLGRTLFLPIIYHTDEGKMDAVAK